MSLVYIGPNTGQNYHNVPLIDSNQNNLGNLYLCNRKDLTKPILPTLTGKVFPGAVNNPPDFPTKFDEIANLVGVQLQRLNQSLRNMHTSWMTNSQVNCADKNEYLNAALGILVTLGLMPSNGHGKLHKYWPLVPINNGQTPNTINSDLVSTLAVKNPNFPNKPHGNPGHGPDKDQALYFFIPIPNDGRNAIGSIAFYQDCEWDPSNPNAKKWSSWGFVSYFSLTLFEEAAQSSLGNATGTQSSSSSSYYAASSSLPSL